MDAAQRKLELWRAATDDEPDVFGIAALLGTIPDTVSAVIRFANSSYVGAVYPVASVLDAVVRIGGRQVGAIALASLNREIADRWEMPELAVDALAVARAARMIGRLYGFPRRESETLFVAGLFSSAGAAALSAEDPGYLSWRANQWVKGLSEDQMLRRERMAYEVDHVVAASRLLDEWNMPTSIIDAVASHHEPRNRFDLALWAGMTVPDSSSPARCHDTPFGAAMDEIGLAKHVDSVRVEALRYVEAVFGDGEAPGPVAGSKRVAERVA